MSIIFQPVFEIPPDIALGLAEGIFKRVGGVVYHAAGTGKTGIVAHLKEIATVEKAKSALTKAVEFFSTSKGKVVIVGLGLVAIGTGAGVWYKWRTKKKQQAEVMERIERYNLAFGEYLDAINNRELDINAIERLIKNLEAMKKTHDAGGVTFDFTSKQFEALVNLICDYTEKLAEANSTELHKRTAAPTTERLFNDLKRCLEFQRKVFNDAA